MYVDRLTKLKRFAAARTTDGSVQLAGTTLRTIIGPHGMPKSIVSDRDPRITARFWRELSRVLGSDVNLSTAQHPQSDGQSEREIQTLITALRSYVNAMGDDWDEYLPALELAFNSKQQASTGAAPFTLVYGTEARLPIDCALDEARPATVPAAGQRAERMKLALDHARSQAELAQAKQKRLADRHRRLLQLKEGDQVLLSTEGLQLRSGTHKLTGRYIGPFRVHGHRQRQRGDAGPAAAAGRAAPDLQHLAPQAVPRRHAAVPRSAAATAPAAGRESGHQRRRRVRGGVRAGAARQRRRRELLVRWKGYGAEHDQWQLRSRADAHGAAAVAEYDALQQGGSQRAAQAALYQLCAAHPAQPAACGWRSAAVGLWRTKAKLSGEDVTGLSPAPALTL